MRCILRRSGSGQESMESVLREEESLWWNDFVEKVARASGLSGGVDCAILRLTVSLEHQIVTDRRRNRRKDGRTDTGP